MKSSKVSRTVTGVVLAGALTLGVVPAAHASASTSAVSSSSVSLSASPAAAPSAAEAPASTTAVPIAVRLAVKAGMAVLKRTQVKWYNLIIKQVNRGRATFVTWWDKSVPTWIKKTLGVGGAAIGGNAAYDALLWVLGLN